MKIFHLTPKNYRSRSRNVSHRQDSVSLNTTLTRTITQDKQPFVGVAQFAIAKGEIKEAFHKLWL